MSPAPQAVSPRGKQTDRVALTHGIKKFLRERPVILMPELNNNQNMKNTIKKPLQNGQKVRLPMSKMTIVNDLLPNHNNNSLDKRLKSKDLRDDESRKSSFLSALNLVDIVTAEKDATARASVASEVYAIESTLGKKFRTRKGQVVSFFRNNPVPISSTLGKKIVLVAGFGKCTNPTDEAFKIDKICSLHKRNLHTSVQWPEVNTRKAKLKGQYIHTYSFGSRQRSKRQVELTIGLSERCFPLFNQCRDVVVPLRRMTDEDIALELAKLSELSQSRKAMGVSTLPYHWISSEPIPGPSRGVELIRTPVVELYDIRQSPSKAKYFR